MKYALVCVPALDGVAVAPCGTMDGVALMPTVQPVPEFDPSTGPVLVGWSISIAGGLWLVGFVIGSIIKVIRSA